MANNNSKNTSADLEEIADLEEKYDITGISFSVKDGMTVTTAESSDLVKFLIRRAAGALKVQRG